MARTPRKSRANPWTAERKAIFEDYVGLIKSALGLSDWTVTMNWKRLPVDSLAEINRWENQRRATMYVGTKFLDQSADDRRNTVVHELVHCLLFDLHDVAARSVDVMGGKAGELANIIIADEIEKTTDVLTSLLEKDLPYLELDI